MPRNLPEFENIETRLIAMWIASNPDFEKYGEDEASVPTATAAFFEKHLTLFAALIATALLRVNWEEIANFLKEKK